MYLHYSTILFWDSVYPLNSATCLLLGLCILLHYFFYAPSSSPSWWRPCLSRSPCCCCSPSPSSCPPCCGPSLAAAQPGSPGQPKVMVIFSLYIKKAEKTGGGCNTCWEDRWRLYYLWEDRWRLYYLWEDRWRLYYLWEDGWRILQYGDDIR